ncbi:MAG TPA: phosphoenolpyruvate carboxykinase, partial [Actinomycetota bacterium]|nr:phosphoenolpyruvate carboxykinase [Actinomycetota bacterium]
RNVFDNPSPDELRKFTEEMPTCRVSEYDNPNVQTRVVSRSAGSTYVATDDPSVTDSQTITREEYERVARMQDDYIREQDMLVIDGYIGNDPDFRTAARLVIERANANIAGMQQKLYYPGEGAEPEVTVIYTPNLKAEGYPDDRLIAVDLESNVTRVINSDYFGESKKGGLRMWNRIVFDRGGLSLHAGLKAIPVGGEEKVGLIIGLSGTGKTTTTFTKQNDSLPAQDDFIALMPGGHVYGSENGCFAKTFSLDPDFEPAIYGAVTKPTAYLENVYQDEDGTVNFFETSYTKNGRAVFGLDDLGAYKDPRDVGKVDFMLILNRNENIIPAVARLTRTQAAAYFMLGETTGTSAGGAAEAGKFLRVPGTNPFFPLRQDQHGNRILELLDSHPDMDVYLMNTGRVGGKDDDDRSKKVKIPHSSACVRGIAEGTIAWTDDPDFGYEIAERVPDLDDDELLQPRRLYERQGRMDEYDAMVDRLKTERLAFLERFEGLDEEIVKAVG